MVRGRIAGLAPAVGIWWFCGVPAAAIGEESIRRWDFQNPADVQGWVVGRGVEDLAVEDGCLTGRITHEDAYVFAPPIEVPMDGLVIRVRARSDRDGDSQLYWRTDKSPEFGEVCVAHRHTPKSSDFIEFEFALGNASNADDRLTGFRIDPYNGNADGRFAIDWVELRQLPPRYEVRLAASEAQADKGDVVTARVTVRQQGGRLNRKPYRIEAPVGIVSQITPSGPGKPATLGREVRLEKAGVNVVRVRAMLPEQGGAYDLETSVTCGVCDQPTSVRKIRSGPLTLELIPSAEATDAYGAARLWRETDGKQRQVALVQPLAELCISTPESPRLQRHPVFKLAASSDSAFELQSDVDAGGPWRIIVAFKPDSRREGFCVEAGLTAPEGGRLLKFAGPTLLAGEPGADPLKRYGLFPGLEFLAPDWRSSSEESIGTKFADRWSPHPYKITVPLMAIEQNGLTTAVLWNPLQSGDPQNLPTATFASPNFLHGQANHLMQLSLPSIPRWQKENAPIAEEPFLTSASKPVRLSFEIVSAAGERVVGMCRRWYDLYGTPQSPPPPHDAAQTYDLLARHFGETMFWASEKGWRHHWFLDKSSRPIPFMQAELAAHAVRTGNREWLQKTQLESQLSIIQTLGPLRQRVNQPQGADQALAAQRPDGTYEFRNTEAMKEQTRRHTGGQYDTLGDDGSTSLGTCVQAALPLIHYAVLTCDEKYVAGARKALDAMRQFRVPRGAQVWEVHQQIPDIRAAALAVEAFRLGYVMTGESPYLEEAVYWADAGLPFLYSWRVPSESLPARVSTGRDRDSNVRGLLPAGELFENPVRQVTPYATIPVFGTTFYVASWFGNVVQWCGLEWAWKVAELLPIRPDPILEAAATGVLNSGLQQTFDRPPWVGLYPDVWDMLSNTGMGALICAHLPLECLKNLGRVPRWTSVWQTGIGDGPGRMVVSGWGSVRKQAFSGSGSNAKLNLTVSFASQQPNEIVVARCGRPKAISVGGQPLAADASGDTWSYDTARRLLLIGFRQASEDFDIQINW